MSEWKPIAECPLNKEVIVRGGKWAGEINWHPEPYGIATVITKNGSYFSVTNTDAYSAEIQFPEEFMDVAEPPKESE